jgi:predicted RNA-binding Zn ribbon-like protein
VPPSAPWDWLGEHLAVDFANTVRRHRDGDAELITGPEELEAWLVREAGRVPVPAPIDPAVVGRFLSLRDHALAVLRAAAGDRPLPVADAEAINAVVLAHPTVRVLGECAGVQPSRVLGAGDDVDALLATLAAAVIELLARVDAGRLAVCDAPSCGQLFLRARTDQRWCGPGCGNRVRVARHHARSVRQKRS